MGRTGRLAAVCLLGFGTAVTGLPSAGAEETTSAPPPSESAPPAEDPLASEAPGPSAGYDLRVGLVFDKAVYRIDETVVATLTVENAGTEAAEVRGVDGGGTGLVFSWPEVPGDYPAGAKKTFTSRTRVSRLDADDRAEGYASVLGRGADANPEDNSARVSARFTFDGASYSGTAYGDADLDGVLEPDEPAAGVTVTAYNADFKKQVGTVTDDRGRFSLDGLPPGRHDVRFDGWPWERRETALTLREGQGVEEDVRLVGSPAALQTTLSLDKERYRGGDAARLTATVSNNSSAAVPAVRAMCRGVDTAAPGWGGFAMGGPGSTVLPGQTVTLTPVHRVTPRDVDTGELDIACDFDRMTPSGPRTAYARALVDGGVAAVTAGRLHRAMGNHPTHGLYGEPLPGLTVYLRDRDTGAVLVRAVSDAAGVFRFRSVPTGRYTLHVAGPWSFRDSRYHVTGDEDGDWTKHLMLLDSGPEQPDPGPVPTGPATTTTATAPPPQARPAPAPDGLARTGAELRGVAAAGGLLLVWGTLLLLRAKRSRRDG